MVTEESCDTARFLSCGAPGSTGVCLAVAGNRCAVITMAAQVWETIITDQPAVSLQCSASCGLKSCQPVIRRAECYVTSTALFESNLLLTDYET